MNQLLLILPERLTKYLVNHKGKPLECWYTCEGWITSNYRLLEDDHVTIIERIGIPSEIYIDK